MLGQCVQRTRALHGSAERAIAALGHFLGTMEAGLATDDATGPTKAAFDTLLDELRAVAALRPESGRDPPPR